MAASPRFAHHPTPTNPNLVRTQEELECSVCGQPVAIGSSMIWDPVNRSLTCRSCQLADAVRAAPSLASDTVAARQSAGQPAARSGRSPARPLLARVTDLIWGEPSERDGLA